MLGNQHALRVAAQGRAGGYLNDFDEEFYEKMAEDFEDEFDEEIVEKEMIKNKIKQTMLDRMTCVLDATLTPAAARLCDLGEKGGHSSGGGSSVVHKGQPPRER